jgi:ATP-dependent DNA ligase
MLIALVSLIDGRAWREADCDETALFRISFRASTIIRSASLRSTRKTVVGRRFPRRGSLTAPALRSAGERCALLHSRFCRAARRSCLAAVITPIDLKRFAFLALPPTSGMSKSAFRPCTPTRGTKVPDRPEWLPEVKYDGYRLIIQREGKRVRLFTRNGHDWSDKYPLIVEAALRNHCSSLIDGPVRRWSAGLRWIAQLQA